MIVIMLRMPVIVVFFFLLTIRLLVRANRCGELSDRTVCAVRHPLQVTVPFTVPTKLSVP